MTPHAAPETLRVNGAAQISAEPQRIKQGADERRRPTVVIRVRVAQACLHCAKGFMHSRLWSMQAQVPCSGLPTMDRMISEQAGLHSAEAPLEQTLECYKADL